MTINFAKYVRPEVVLRDLGYEAKRFLAILSAELSGERDGDGTWHGSDAFHMALTEIAPLMAELADVYVKAVALQTPPPDEADIF